MNTHVVLNCKKKPSQYNLVLRGRLLCVCEMGKKRGGDKNTGLGKTIMKERSRGYDTACIFLLRG